MSFLSEKKEISRLAVWGVINIVRRNWLDDCHHVKKQVHVTVRHMVSDTLLAKGLFGIGCLFLDPFCSIHKF